MSADRTKQAQNVDPADKRGESHMVQPNTNAEGILEQEESGLFALEREKMEHERKQQKGMRGWLGRLFGGGDEKAGNIAGLMAIACFIAIAALLLTADMWENVDATAAVLGATLTACLGYLFGRR